jgi:putative multiple sugar transport system permease protein
MEKNKRVLEALKQYTMLLALLAVVAVFEVLIRAMDKGSVFRPTNLSNLIGQNGYVVVLATGMLLCIIGGGNIDLSVGSVVALIGALGGKLMITYKVNIYLTILICLLAGIAIGALQGSFIAYLRIPAFIVTLAGMLMFRGLAWVILQSQTLAPFPTEYKNYFNTFFPQVEGVATDPAVKAHVLRVSVILGAAACIVIIAVRVYTTVSRARKGYRYEKWKQILEIIITAVTCAAIMALSFQVGQNKGIPVIVVLLAAVVLGYNYFTTRTIPGRHFYAMGGNEKAARLSGINTDNILFIAYTNMGFLSAVAALMCIARFDSAAPSAGEGYEMDAIAACFIGGASAYGGVGKVSGAVIGAIFMGVLNNGMSILGVGADWQRVVKGAVLLMAVAFDVLSRRRGEAA